MHRKASDINDSRRSGERAEGIPSSMLARHQESCGMSPDIFRRNRDRILLRLKRSFAVIRQLSARRFSSGSALFAKMLMMCSADDGNEPTFPDWLPGFSGWGAATSQLQEKQKAARTNAKTTKSRVVEQCHDGIKVIGSTSFQRRKYPDSL